jgi:hypothetical protein
MPLVEPSGLVVLRIADRRLQEIFLVERVEQRLLDLRVVEGLDRRVEAERILVAQRVDVRELDVAVLLQHRQEVVRGLLDVVDLSGDQRVDRSLLVGDDAPLDAVDLDHLAAGHA